MSFYNKNNPGAQMWEQRLGKDPVDRREVAREGIQKILHTDEMKPFKLGAKDRLHRFAGNVVVVPVPDILDFSSREANGLGKKLHGMFDGVQAFSISYHLDSKSYDKEVQTSRRNADFRPPFRKEVLDELTKVGVQILSTAQTRDVHFIDQGEKLTGFDGDTYESTSERPLLENLADAVSYTNNQCIEEGFDGEFVHYAIVGRHETSTLDISYDQVQRNYGLVLQGYDHQADKLRWQPVVER